MMLTNEKAFKICVAVSVAADMGELSPARLREICKGYKVSRSLISSALVESGVCDRPKFGRYVYRTSTSEAINRFCDIANQKYREKAAAQRARKAKAQGREPEPVSVDNYEATLGAISARVEKLETITTALARRLGVTLKFARAAAQRELKLVGGGGK